VTEHISEERLALYAARDLPARETASVETHLRCCGECQALVTEYQDAQAFLTESVEDPSPDELRRLRDGIAHELTSVGHHAPAPWLWPALLTPALALTLIFVTTWQRLVYPRHSREESTGQVIVPQTIPALPALPTPRLETVALPKKAVRPTAGLRTVALLQRADESPFIKMTTPDPNVVILWQASERIQ